VGTIALYRTRQHQRIRKGRKVGQAERLRTRPEFAESSRFKKCVPLRSLGEVD
jgi:hypothetical protein